MKDKEGRCEKRFRKAGVPATVPELVQQSLGPSPTHVPPAIHYLWGAQRSRYTIGALKMTVLVLAGCTPNLLSEAGTCNMGEQQGPFVALGSHV